MKNNKIANEIIQEIFKKSGFFSKNFFELVDVLKDFLSFSIDSLSSIEKQKDLVSDVLSKKIKNFKQMKKDEQEKLILDYYKNDNFVLNKCKKIDNNVLNIKELIAQMIERIS